MGANVEEDDDDDYDITKYATPKTAQEKEEIKKAIANNFLFAHPAYALITSGNEEEDLSTGEILSNSC